MFEKKSFKGFGIALVLVIIMTSLGSPGVYAESINVAQPTQMDKAIQVELNDDYFNPKNITIPNGKTTTLILKNQGKKEHTFTVEKLNIDVEVKPGKEQTITVKPNTPGTYELICRYHFREGMVGNVIVK